MVFEDPTRIRSRLFAIIAAAAVLACLLLVTDVVLSLVTAPSLPTLPLSSARSNQSTGTHEPISDPRPAPPVQSCPRLPARDGLSDGPFARTAFVVQDDPASIADLKRNIGRLDAVFPDWYSIDTSDGKLRTDIGPESANLLRSGNVRVLPRISNTDSRGAWHGEILGDLFEETGGEKLITALVSQLASVSADGVNVDFEELDPSDRDSYLDWLERLARELHARHMLLTVDVPVGEEETFDYEMIGQIADAVVVMGYDEHYPGSAPGPVASQGWFDDAIEDMAQRIDPRKLIAAIGAYGYDWNVSAKTPADAVAFDDVMELARAHGARVETEKDSVNSTFSYQDSGGAHHQVWFLDGVSAWNQYLTARQFKYGGVSLWRLGMEEPALWDFFSADSSDSGKATRLGKVELPAPIVFHGEGELLEVRQLANEGARTLSFDGRKIDYARYDRLPAPYDVQKRGHSEKKQVALTFDDGPDPTWTPRVLEILRAHGVPATFFVIGEQVQKFPELVAQEFDQGHLVGNHTFLHPDVGLLSDRRLRFELTATQRLIESVTGRQTLLFRTPYDTDSAPTLEQQLRPLYVASQSGYVCAGGDVDSEDYNQPGVQRIIQNVLGRLKETGSNVVVMHDAGGDRAQTVQALAQLIPLLKQQGYSFVTLADLLGGSREQIMPRLGATEQVVVAGDRAVSWFANWGWWLLMKIFLVTTGFALLRSALLGVLVYARSRRKPLEAAGHFTPPVLVLIPAYNEEKVIRRTLDAVLQSDYPNFRVLVVDDGSTDRTADIVGGVARAHPQVNWISKPNGGKFSALNRGLREAWEEYVVTIDADTIILPDTISHLIAPFAGQTVDAVCGNVQVGNRNGLLTRFQDVEYVTSQNYDRRAFDAANCIPVVPGATGAWRRRTVLRAGGYSPDTLTEDADLTLSLLCRGAKIVYQPLAKSITEAPRDTKALLRQRFRWGYGTLQSLWKHRGYFGRGSLGWIALPNLLLFQLIFPTLAPLSLIVLVAAAIRGAWLLPLIWFAVFVVVDLTGAAVAFRLERRSFKELWVVLAQRFYYRPFMYVVTLRSLLAAVIGRRHGWNKLERHGSVLLDVTLRPAMGWDLSEPAASHTAA